MKEARKKINEIDRQMADLFEQRMAVVREVAAYKKARGLRILDEDREKQVLANNSAYIQDETLKPYYMTFMQNTMAVSRQYQERLISGDR